MMNKKIPMRQCIGCREMKPKRELIRILKNKQQELSVDRTGKKNGRGAYIMPFHGLFPSGNQAKRVRTIFPNVHSAGILHCVSKGDGRYWNRIIYCRC